MFSSIEMCHFVVFYSSFCFHCINQDLIKYFCNNRKKRISRSIYLYISMSQNYYMNDGCLIHNLIDAILIGLEIFALKNNRLNFCKQIWLTYYYHCSTTPNYFLILIHGSNVIIIVTFYM